MSRSKQALFIVVPVFFLFAMIYPYLPWRGFGLCAVKHMVKINCPGCGFIRSVVALSHGQFRRSIDLNPMGMVAVVLIVSLWLKVFILSPILKREFNLSPRGIKIVSLAFVAGLFTQWVFYLICVLPRV